MLEVRWKHASQMSALPTQPVVDKKCTAPENSLHTMNRKQVESIRQMNAFGVAMRHTADLPLPSSPHTAGNWLGRTGIDEIPKNEERTLVPSKNKLAVA